MSEEGAVSLYVHVCMTCDGTFDYTLYLVLLRLKYLLSISQCKQACPSFSGCRVQAGHRSFGRSGFGDQMFHGGVGAKARFHRKKRFRTWGAKKSKFYFALSPKPSAASHSRVSKRQRRESRDPKTRV